MIDSNSELRMRYLFETIFNHHLNNIDKNTKLRIKTSLTETMNSSGELVTTGTCSNFYLEGDMFASIYELNLPLDLSQRDIDDDIRDSLKKILIKQRKSNSSIEFISSKNQLKPFITPRQEIGLE